MEDEVISTEEQLPEKFIEKVPFKVLILIALVLMVIVLGLFLYLINNQADNNDITSVTPSPETSQPPVPPEPSTPDIASDEQDICTKIDYDLCIDLLPGWELKNLRERIEGVPLVYVEKSDTSSFYVSKEIVETYSTSGVITTNEPLVGDLDEPFIVDIMGQTYSTPITYAAREDTGYERYIITFYLDSAPEPVYVVSKVGSQADLKELKAMLESIQEDSSILQTFIKENCSESEVKDPLLLPFNIEPSVQEILPDLYCRGSVDDSGWIELEGESKQVLIGDKYSNNQSKLKSNTFDTIKEETPTFMVENIPVFVEIPKSGTFGGIMDDELLLNISSYKVGAELIIIPQLTIIKIPVEGRLQEIHARYSEPYNSGYKGGPENIIYKEDKMEMFINDFSEEFLAPYPNNPEPYKKYLDQLIKIQNGIAIK